LTGNPGTEIVNIDDREDEARKIVMERVEEMLKTSARDVSNKMNQIRGVPTIGLVPAGYPLPNEQGACGEFPVLVEHLGSAMDTRNLFALIVTGESLIGDKIYPGIHVIINPYDKDVVDDKICLVRIDNAVTIKHVCLRDAVSVLCPSIDEYAEIVPNPDALEIIGRVVHKGTGETL
jgi:SOS-response transcriptional repressor LexA